MIAAGSLYKHISLLPFCFYVEPLLAQLKRNEDLWDQYIDRKTNPISPHREVQDIWLRYNNRENFHGNMQTFNDKHESVWYPSHRKLSAAVDLTMDLFDLVEGETLGGVLLTRIPAGKQVYPHTDGGWHASTYEKFAIQVKGNHEQSFNFEGEQIRPKSGQSFWFNNAFPHWVKNDSSEERITLIICIKRRDTCPSAS